MVEEEEGADDDHKVDWSTIKVFVKSRPKTLDADAKLSEDDIFLIILEHTGEERARILANMAINVREIKYYCQSFNLSVYKIPRILTAS